MIFYWIGRIAELDMMLRVIAGTLMTSLNMPGFSISLVLLPREPTAPSLGSDLRIDKDLLLDLLDAPADAPGWKWTASTRPSADALAPKDNKRKVQAERVGKKGPERVSWVANTTVTETDSIRSQRLTRISSSTLYELRQKLPSLPSQTSHGSIQLRVTETRGRRSKLVQRVRGETICLLNSSFRDNLPPQGLLAALGENKIPSNNVAEAFVVVSDVVEKKMGGTSGGFYRFGFRCFPVAI
jgi:dihydroxyacetone kinase